VEWMDSFFLSSVHLFVLEGGDLRGIGFEEGERWVAEWPGCKKDHVACSATKNDRRSILHICDTMMLTIDQAALDRHLIYSMLALNMHMRSREPLCAAGCLTMSNVKFSPKKIVKHDGNARPTEI